MPDPPLPQRDRAHRRDMNELYQGAVVAGPLQCLPIGIVAKIPPGIARQPRRHAGRTRRAEKPREWCFALERRGLSWRDRAARWPIAARIRKQDRYGVTGPCLDAEVTPAAGKAEYQDDVRLLREEFWQVAIDRSIDGGEDMNATLDVGESRTPPAGERCSHARTWIERRAGKRSEAGKKDPHGFTLPASWRSVRQRRPAPAGRPRRRPRGAAMRP